MNIKDQFRMGTVQKLLKLRIVEKSCIFLVILALTEKFITLVLQPASPCRHDKDGGCAGSDLSFKTSQRLSPVTGICSGL